MNVLKSTLNSIRSKSLMQRNGTAIVITLLKAEKYPIINLQNSISGKVKLLVGTL